MPLSNILRVSRHITFVAFKLNQRVKATKSSSMRFAVCMKNPV
ncbi:hypothetical protein T08_9425 [Trichinella sp. T8]|nr:hypothetical protein T08_9425 [Trichinella sp. T8]